MRRTKKQIHLTLGVEGELPQVQGLGNTPPLELGVSLGLAADCVQP